jgi:hypothetical protein
MVRQITRALAAFLVIGAISFPAAVHADDEGVTQCKFAKDLALRIGISLPNTATSEDIFGLLMAEGIMPKDGWNCNKVVTVGDFARLIVLVLERESGDKMVSADLRDDDNAFIEAAKEAGYSLESIEDTLAGIQSMEEKTGPSVNREQTTTDPTDARHIFGQPDERSGGTDSSIEITFPNNNILQALAPAAGAPAAPAAPATSARSGGGSSAPVSSAAVTRALRQLPTERPTPTTTNRPG